MSEDTHGGRGWEATATGWRCTECHHEVVGPVDVHVDDAHVCIGTDRVELNGPERREFERQYRHALRGRIELEGLTFPPTPQLLRCVESIVAVRVQALTAERDEARTAHAELIQACGEKYEALRDRAKKAAAELGSKNDRLAAELATANTRCAELEAQGTKLADGLHAWKEESLALQATLDRVTALADEWDENGINCECGHSIGGEHNGLGCYARLSYDPLVTCECKLTDDQFESDVAVRDLLAALTPEGTE